MQVTGTITDMNIDFKTGKPKLTLLVNEKQLALNGYDELLDKDKLSIEIKQYRNKRSKDANAYFHVLVNQLARHYNLSDEDMKIKMVLQYGTLARSEDNKVSGVMVPKNTNILKFYPYAKWIGEIEKGGMLFDKYIFYERTHLLDSLQMSQLINGIVQECKDCGIPTLDEIELNRMIESWEGGRK